MFSWLQKMIHRQPDLIIGGADDPYMLRWYLIPRNSIFNIYLHKFVRDDEDRALHDHPWASLSIVISGGYFDITPGPDTSLERRYYGPLSIIFRRATASHRVELKRVGEFHASQFISLHRDIFKKNPVSPAWTLFITGPRVREWGFWCPQGWRHWREFTAGKNGETIGKGCD